MLDERVLRDRLRQLQRRWAAERENIAEQTLIRIREETAAFERETRIFAVHSDAVVILNSAGEVSRANRAFTELAGRGLAELTGQPLQRFMPSLFEEHALVERLLADTTISDLRCVVPRKDGQDVHVSVSGSKIATGRHVEFILILRDLTETQRRLAAEAAAEAEREKAEELQHLLCRLEHANRELASSRRQLLHADRLAAIGQMAAGVAHEINNPATFVLANLELACEDLQQLAQRSKQAGRHDEACSVLGVEEMLSQCGQGMHRIRSITRDLNTFSRIERDEQELVDINSLLRLASRMVANQLRSRGTLELELGTVPAILADKGKLAQVMINLLINAVQALEEGREKANRITLRTNHCDGVITIQVSDTGPGIPEHILPRIFEPFFTTKTRDAGTGLGLSLSSEIIRAHGGTIEVSSCVARGTTFTITLPTRRSDD